MRALRVVGLGEDGKIVILESDRGERFQVPADERLRAAARGDITRLGQIAIELESQMRPREIQSRIRAGESVEQVAAAAGVPPERVERFAYPVLLERSRTAELAQRAHPVREDGPDVQELGEVVAQSFTARGQDYAAAVWDSWKGEDGKWVVQLTWTAGRSNNHAHWSFHPGAHGGTVTPLDDHALDLLDPNPNRGLRTVRPVTELAAQALQVAEPRRQAVNGGEPPRRVEEQDFVQDFELTDDASPVGLVGQQELPVEEAYGRGYPREYRTESYREPEQYRPAEPTRQAERAAEPVRHAERPAERHPEPAYQEERPAEPTRQAERPAEQVRQAERPAEPVQAERPAEQVQAERPAEQVQAERPAEPVQAERPAEPVQAERPAEPVQAERPAEPVHQAELPAEPVRQEGPVEAPPEPVRQAEPEPAAATAAPVTPAALPSPAAEEPATPATSEEQAASAARPAEAPAPAAASPVAPEEVEPAPSAVPEVEEAAEETPAAKAEPTPPPAPAAPARKKGRKARPSVPSWEDVLLGTRSNR
ncbi:MAG: septation protein SepH [Actinophytocola sp.]|uniref:septation protein SepH n=1 Tax=Actinophytocola sp. TaxID=1872138 RepID=UPI003C7503E5